MTSYLKLYNNNENLKTLKQFADFHKIKFNSKFTIDDFFELNKENIYSQLHKDELQSMSEENSETIKELAESLDKNVTLPCPCYLFIEEKYISYSLIAKNNTFQAQLSDTIAFQDEQIKSIFEKPMTKFSNRIGSTCRVIGWFKTMYFAKHGSENNHNLDNIYDLKQNFLDLSKFVISLSTNVGKNGGTFQISFPHIPLYNANLQGNSYESLSEKGNSSVVDKNQQTDENTIRTSINSFDYFEWLIQTNDLLFISFDKMEDLKDDNLSGHNFDMIGLIDSVSISKNANGQINVDVSGRDLMKILSEDSSIFFYQGVSSGDENVFKSFDNTETVIYGGDKDSVMLYNGGQTDANGTLRQLNGSINIFACEPNDFSIDFVLKTVVSHLANMSIVPDDLFISWGDKRTKFSALQTKNV